MAAPKNARGGGAPYQMDPLLNFKFLILWDGKVVAGVSKVGALSRTPVTPNFREGGAPQVVRKMPGQNSGDITLERGLITDVAFEQWANKVWFYENSGALGQEVSLADFRKDITIQVRNQAGQIIKQYKLLNCWPTEYQAMPELDARSDQVALETLTLANDGWQLDDSATAPTPADGYPSFAPPDAPEES